MYHNVCRGRLVTCCGIMQCCGHGRGGISGEKEARHNSILQQLLKHRCLRLLHILQCNSPCTDRPSNT